MNVHTNFLNTSVACTYSPYPTSSIKILAKYITQKLCLTSAFVKNSGIYNKNLT